jgi:hypothetical protein
MPAGLAAKAKRVTGTFVLMIGTGMILDCRAPWIGVPLMAIGALAFARGMLDGRVRETAPEPLGETTESRP